MQSLTQTTSSSKILDYQISQKRLLGKGAFSKVYLGQSSNGTKAAIKKIKKTNKTNDVSYKLAKQQSNILNGLNSSYICSLLGTHQQQANYYLILKYCQGKTLATILKERKKIPFLEALIIFRLLIKSLKYILSKNIMHRDLKPQNIIYHNQKATLIDFGFACKISKDDEKVIKERVGTPIYMSPQILCKRKYNSKSDIWSLGVILYQMVHGYPPYRGKTEDEILKHIKTQQLKIEEIMVSGEVKMFIKQCLVTDVDKRISWSKLFQLANISKNFEGIIFEQKETSFCRCWS